LPPAGRAITAVPKTSPTRRLFGIRLRALQRRRPDDPKYITRFLTLFEKVEPATGTIRWSYPVVWNEPGVGEMRFHCFASSANEEDGLSFQDWIPLDASIWEALTKL